MAEKRDSILNAATMLFSRKPYHMVVMDDIARQARVAKGTLYYHFNSKEDLYITLFKDGLDDLLVRLRADASDEPVRDLRMFIESLFFFLYERKDFYEMYKREEGRLLSKKLKNCYDKTCSIKELLDSLLQRGIEQGIFRSNIEVQIVTEMALGMIKNSISAGSGAMEIKKRVDTIFDLLLYGVKKFN